MLKPGESRQAESGLATRLHVSMHNMYKASFVPCVLRLLGTINKKLITFLFIFAQNSQLPLAPVGVSVVDKRSRSIPWNEVTAGPDKPHPLPAYEDEPESLPPVSSHLANLGPIGPPSRYICMLCVCYGVRDP